MGYRAAAVALDVLENHGVGFDLPHSIRGHAGSTHPPKVLKTAGHTHNFGSELRRSATRETALFWLGIQNQ